MTAPLGVGARRGTAAAERQGEKDAQEIGERIQKSEEIKYSDSSARSTDRRQMYKCFLYKY